MDDDAVTDLMTLVQRRSDLLEHLRAEPREKRALVADLDTPRSTLDRAVRELESAGLVAYDEGAYAVTALGEHLLAECTAFRERVAYAVDLEPFLRWTDPETLDLDLRWLADAEVWTPEPGDPWAMVNHHVEALESPERVRGALPLVGLHAVETVGGRVAAGDLDVQLAVQPSVAERLRTDDRYVPHARDLQAGPDPTFVRYDGTIPYFLGVFDDAFVQIGVDDDGEPRALLESDDERVLAWARERVDEYLRASEPLELPDEDAGN